MTILDEQSRLPSNMAMWYTLLSGPVLWSIHFLLVYLLLEISCRGGVLDAPWRGLNALTWVALAATGVVLAVIVGSALYGWRTLRRLSGQAPLRAENLSRNPRLFMALAGIVMNGIFGLLVLMEGIPGIFLQPCLP